MFRRIDRLLKRKFTEYARSVLQEGIEQQNAEIHTEIEGVRRHMEILQKNIVADVLRGTEQAIANSKMNERTFAKYKNIHQGQKVVICGAGPSLSQYQPIEDAIHIALNRAFLFDKVLFNYVFAQDYRGIELFTKELQEYQGNNCVKFFGTQNGSLDDEIPESYAIACHAERYATDSYIWLYENRCKFAYELDSKSIGNFASIALPAMQFALWTSPKEIYIVGCDSTPSGHFSGEDTETIKKLGTQAAYDRMVEEWKYLKVYAEIYYPDIRIFSVNPVALKGIFKDINL